MIRGHPVMLVLLVVLSSFLLVSSHALGSSEAVTSQGLGGSNLIGILTVNPWSSGGGSNINIAPITAVSFGLTLAQSRVSASAEGAYNTKPKSAVFQAERCYVLKLPILVVDSTINTSRTRTELTAARANQAGPISEESKTLVVNDKTVMSAGSFSSSA
jgi:hypothetical protein